MQKACGIIAVGAIALGASQFAVAQTSPSDQAPQTVAKPALRDEVRDALHQAGFKNIRIISESFLVRAIDQNGDSVVMVVRPESLRTMRAPSDEDTGEANAEDPGYPDQLGDLSEDEEQATAPTPGNGRLGKSSKMTERPPAAESDQQAQAGQNVGNGSAGKTPDSTAENDTANNQPAKNDTAKSAKMTDRQENSGAAEKAEANETPSQSAKMHDGGPNQSQSQAANAQTTTAGGNTKMGTNEAEQGTLQLSAAQRAEIWQSLGKQQAASTPPGFQPAVGATVPATLQLKTLPSSVSSQVPQIQSYGYAMLQNQLLIVDPATKKIVSIINE